MKKRIPLTDIVSEETGMSAGEAGGFLAMAVDALGAKIVDGSDWDLSDDQGVALVADCARSLMSQVIADMQPGNGWGNGWMFLATRAAAERCEAAMKDDDFALWSYIAMLVALDGRNGELPPEAYTEEERPVTPFDR